MTNRSQRLTSQLNEIIHASSLQQIDAPFTSGVSLGLVSPGAVFHFYPETGGGFLPLLTWWLGVDEIFCHFLIHIDQKYSPKCFLSKKQKNSVLHHWVSPLRCCQQPLPRFSLWRNFKKINLVLTYCSRLKKRLAW